MKGTNARSWIVVAVVAAITVFFAAWLPRTTFDNDIFNFVPETNPARAAVTEMTKTYGSQIAMLVGLESRSGDIFSRRKLDQIAALTRRLGELPNVSEITGIMDTRHIRAEGEDILVDSLVPESYSGTDAEIAEIKERILSWDLYRRTLVSDDYGSTQIVLHLDKATEDSANWKNGEDPKRVLYAQVRRVVAESDLGGFDVYMSGMPVFTVLFTDNLRTDLVTLVPLVALVVVGTLLLSFRRLGGLLLPLITVVISTIWTMGFMAMLGRPLSILSTVIPVIMMAVGSAYGIHVVSHYYDELRALGRRPDRAENSGLVRATVAKVAWPVTLAALTTFAGFASNSVTSIVPMRTFGLFAGFGVLVALGVSLTLIPALLEIRGIAPTGSRRERLASGSLGLVDRIETLVMRVTGKPKTVLAGALVVVAVSLVGAGRIVVDNAVIEYFKDHTEIARSDRFLRTKFNGTKTFSFVVRGEGPGSLNDPDALAAMDGLASYLETCSPDVGKVVSYTQFIKRINQVFNIDEPAAGVVRRGSGTASDAAAGAEGEPAFGFGTTGGDEEPAFGFDSPSGEAEAAPARETGGVSRAEGRAAPPPPQVVDIAVLNAALASSGSAEPSVSEWLDRINRATNFRGAAYYEIPADPARYGFSTKEELSRLVANYLVLLGDGVSGFANDPLEPSEALITIQTRSTGNISIHGIVSKGLAWAEEHFPEGYTVFAAGPAMVEKSITDSIVGNQVLSVVVSLCAVFLIMALFYRSVVAGLLALVPLGVAIIINFGVMGFAGIKLDISTAIVASLAIGIGIDYTIHYIAAYRRARGRTADLARVKELSIRSSGKAIMFNALAVGAGFGVLAASQFNPLMYLGILIALTMATSSLSALVLLPVLLDLLHPAFLLKPLRAEPDTEYGGIE